MSEHLPGQPGIAQAGPAIEQQNPAQVPIYAEGSSVFSHLRNRWATIAAAASAVVAVAAAPSFEGQPAYAANTETAIIGMPFGGKWASPSLVNPDSKGNYSDLTSSHPSVHAHGGSSSPDWATDIYVAPGTEAKLAVSDVSGAATYSVSNVADTSCNAGKRVRVNVKVDNVSVGWVQYEHLETGLEDGDLLEPGDVLGKTKNWGNLPCYVVTNDGGVHLHVAMKNVEDKYSCYTGHGRPGEFSLAEGASLGMLGSVNNGTKQACSANSTTPKDDYVIYRLAGNAGYWYGKSAPAGTSQINPTWGVNHGSPGDVPFMGDFDGDGYDDFGIYRTVNNTGTWYVKSSGTGSPTAIWGAMHGSPGDIPVAGDVNGDRIADFGIYRMGADNVGRWYFKSDHNGGLTPIWGSELGSPGDIPVVGDMNNDDIDDFGVYTIDPNNSNGYWYFKSSGNGQPTPIWEANHGGWSGDKPVVGDINGDGIDDFGIYRVNPNNSTGYWYFKSGHNGQPITNGWGATHGSPGDVPFMGRLD